MTDSVISFGFEPNREDAITPRDVDWSTSNYRRHAPFLCPITRYPCEGDLSHLCEEYGCARRVACRPAQAKICETAVIRCGNYADLLRCMSPLLAQSGHP